VSAPSGATSPASSGAKNLVVTSTVRTQLIAAFASAHHLPVAEVGGTFPGSVFYAYDSATETYWAEAFFSPARTDSMRVADSFQDAGGDGIFSRSATGQWRFLSGGAPLICAQERDVPRAVVAVWGLPQTSSSCSSP